MRGVRFIGVLSLLAGVTHSTCQHNKDYTWRLKKTIKFQLRFESGYKFKHEHCTKLEGRRKMKE
jgi:hypothetical protein